MQEQFEKLIVWQKSMNLVSKIYALTKTFPREEIHGLTGQLRRAAVSVPANISEGKGRYHTKERVQYFHMSRGSVYEIITLIHIAKNLKYIKEEEAKEILISCGEISAMLNSLIQSIQ